MTKKGITAAELNVLMSAAGAKEVADIVRGNGFHPVKCHSCSKVFTYAALGSMVRFRCRGCKSWNVVKV